MDDNAIVNTHDRESRKVYFLQLVEGNEELSEIEKRYCRERYIYHFELQNAMYEWGEPNTWTSGNEIIDDFIHQCQIQSSLPGFILEWIPFDQFENVEKLTEGGFSSIYTATWTRGRIGDYDENKKEFIRIENLSVVLKSLNNSNNLGKAFFKEVGN